MPIVGYILVVAGAYLLGSIPTGFLVARARGLDIRTVGSGNIGATNVMRQLGKAAGIFVLAADAAKGALAVGLAKWAPAVLHWPASPGAKEGLALAAGLAAVLGHNFTCWLRFKGGKGIATSAGALAALVPASLLIILAVWTVVFALTRYVSLGSICASAALPFAAWITGESPVIIIAVSGMAALAIYKHLPNIRRLLDGTESRVARKPGISHQP